MRNATSTLKSSRPSTVTLWHSQAIMANTLPTASERKFGYDCGQTEASLYKDI